MTSRWPEPCSQGDATENAADLATRFESYYQDVFMYTLKNPTAVVPARHVMDMLFLANKIIKMSKKGEGEPGESPFTMPRVQNDTSESDEDTLREYGDENSLDEGNSTGVYCFMRAELGNDDDDSDWESSESDEVTDDEYYEYSEGSAEEDYAEGKSFYMYQLQA